MKALFRAAVPFLLCLLLAGVAPAQKKRRPHRAWGVPLIFSNLDLSLETGDVGGIEVILIRGDSNDWVAVMMAAGVPYDPVLAPVQGRGDQIEFTLPPQGSTNYGKFTGKITRTGLILDNAMRGHEFLMRQSG